MNILTTNLTTMIKNAYYDDLLYKIEYQPKLSNADYTAHTVYYVWTEDKDSSHAHTAIENIMKDNSWREEEYKSKSKYDMASAFHTYHKFSYDQSKQIYIYTHIRPYDD